MKPAHRFPQRLIRWTSLFVCFALLLLTIVPLQQASGSKGAGYTGDRFNSLRHTQSSNGKGKKVPPVPPLAGAPQGLQNLDAVRQSQPQTPKAPPPVPSTMRSRRKPLESRHGRKVGDRLPPTRRANYRTGSGIDQTRIASMTKDSRTQSGTTVRSHHARPSPLLPQGGNATAYLSDLNWTYQYCDYYTTTRDHSVDGTTLTLNGVTYAKGLGVHAYADVRYNLGGGYTNFTSDIGVDDIITSIGSVTFEVWADGQKLYDSGVMTFSSPTQTVSVNVTGKQELKLIVTQAGDGPGYDHADWAGARLTPALISSTDQYVQNFLQKGLGRSANNNEASYWTDNMRSAYSQEQASRLLAMIEFGMTIFESAEYASRGRTNHEYVYDLYETYLMRYPDQDGWNFWTNECNAYGRESLRNAFEESVEFHNIVATLTASGTPSSAVSSLSTARIDPFNQSGDQVRAQDAEWSLPLLSLPGRAGLDLGLSLSYSSLVWTRSGPYVYFDPDNESMSPGFTLGFPTIQWRSFDAQTARNVYLLTAGGRRVELRQIGTSSVYEAADSSYLQLTEYNGGLLLRSTDGTQISYGAFANGWQATQIKDRNGNYLSIANDWRGDIQNITDTLGRVINFNYDGNAHLNSITQNGRSQPWATFGWDTLAIHPSFSGEAAVGTYDGEPVPVLTQVGLTDGTRYNFEYNSNAQVGVIRRIAYDNHELAHTVFTYAPSTSDCPRLSQTLDWVEAWDGAPNGVVTHFNVNGDGSHEMSGPDETVYKEYYGGQPLWARGLILRSEIWSNGVRQKWAISNWTQDADVNYQANPRVYETNIYDSAGNRRRTSVGYYTFTLPDGASCSLPSDVYEYQADAATVYRHAHTDYVMDEAYLTQRIIGLVVAKYLYDGGGNVQSKTAYCYDCDPGMIAGTPGTPIQHDPAYDTTDLSVKRGNQMVEARWDITDPQNPNKQLYRHWAYDTAGSVIFTQDPLNHQNTFSYSDSFSDGNNHNTFAYPTTLTDADGNSSFVKYNYEFGAQTRRQDPLGAIQTVTYDSAGRIDRMTTENNGAYTRYVYSSNWRDVMQYSTIQEGAGEAFSLLSRDGAGRPRARTTALPGGNYAATWTMFDNMGRAAMQSNPTEINPGWVPSSDDAAGWIFTQQTYDWKGRPLLTTHLTDGTTKQASYSACGCAGSDVATLTDEVGRQQKVYHDPLGRVAKTEVMDGSSVYSTTANFYNGRDQLTLVRQFQGNDQSGVYQDTTMSYDGYGRLASKHVPEQNTGTATVYAYNPDDTTLSVTDGRGATCAYGYNNRHQVTSATHTLSGQATIALSYGYDAAGNRTSMSDTQGATSYNYDSISRITSETRSFGALSNSPTGGNYGISYQYNLANELTSVTDPFGAQMSYNRDTAGRVASVTGSGFANISTYASTIQYRAWGGQKSVIYGDGTSATTSYNSRMQASSYLLPGLREQFQYYDDGRLHQMTDLDDRGQDPGYPDTARHFSRAQSYDQVGRLVSATGTLGLPYNQSYSYDEFGNSTSRSGSYYYQGWSSDGGTFQNNRRQDLSYDADGNVTHTPSYNYAGGSVVSFRDWTYDAAGRMSQVKETVTANNSVSTYISNYDGDGQPIVEYYQENLATKSFVVRSSVLGGNVLTRLDNVGNKSSTVFDVDGQLKVVQNVYSSGSSVRWTHIDPLGLSEAGDTKSVFDPMGNYVQWQHAPSAPPNAYPPIAASFGGLGPSFGYAINSACILDGIPTDCSLALTMLDHGSAAQCRNNDCGPQIVRDSGGNQHLAPLSTNPDTGALGYRYWDPTKPREQPSDDGDIIRVNNQGGYVWTDAQDSNDEMNNDIDSIASNTTSCRFNVSFIGSNSLFKNGAGERAIPNVSTGYGVGFTVTGSVRRGAIGAVDVPDGSFGSIHQIVNPKGAWTIQQWVSNSAQASYDKAPGQVISITRQTHADGPDTAFREIKGNHFRYLDFPGPNKNAGSLGDLVYYKGEWDFAAKLINGNQQCEVQFHLSMAFQSGKWTAHWGSR